MAYNDYENKDDQFRSRELGIAEHLIDSERGFARGPERALMSALLFDGVQAYINYAGANSEAARLKYREAFSWVNRVGEDYVFSFDCVCEALGIDPQYLRLGLLNACSSPEHHCKRTRRSC